MTNTIQNILPQPGSRPAITIWPSLAFALLLCFGLDALSSDLQAQTQTTTGYQVKAAFLYNFARFVQWPDEAFPKHNEPFIIGIIGDDPFGPVLTQTIRDKNIDGRKLIVKHFFSTRDLGFCHILFVSSSEKKQFQSLFSRVRSSSTLTVGDFDDFSKSGGMINFTIVKNKVRFEINPQAAEKVGLKISSKLLKLARIVKSK